MMYWFPPLKDPISAHGAEFLVEWSQQSRPVMVTGLIEPIMRVPELVPALRPEEEA